MPDPRPFKIWVTVENEDSLSGEGHDLFMIGMIASPNNLVKSEKEYIRSVIRDTKHIIDDQDEDDGQD